MREIILDTETTGLSPLSGDRLVEIGAVELFNHLPTGETFHVYINPERDMPKEAEAVHGLSAAFLQDKPKFRAVADDLLTFIGTTTLIIHNASFDISFLNAELRMCKKPLIPNEQVIDSLMLARKKFPMGPNSLDALCKRFGVDNSRRTKHGALLDSELLAEVYLELIGGRQTGLNLKSESTLKTPVWVSQIKPSERLAPLPPRLTADEKTRHKELVTGLGIEALWPKT
jgi:DNA polymerase III subunit epsilon